MGILFPARFTVGDGARGEVRLGRVHRLSGDGRQGGQSLAGPSLATPPRAPQGGKGFFRLAELECKFEFMKITQLSANCYGFVSAENTCLLVVTEAGAGGGLAALWRLRGAAPGAAPQAAPPRSRQ